jgi:hypothetical protein
MMTPFDNIAGKASLIFFGVEKGVKNMAKKRKKK